MSMWTNGLWGALVPVTGYPQVATFADLPLATSSTNRVYLVLTATGVWPFNRKPSGLYRSNGATWDYLSVYPDMLIDANFGIQNSIDGTKVMKFDASEITTGQTRTLKAQDSNGTIGLALVSVSKAANYTANPFELVSCDASASSFTVTLPTSPADKTVITIKLNTIANVGSTNYVTVKCGGTDKFNEPTGTTEIYLYLFGSYAQCQYDSSTGLWYTFISAGTLNFATNFPGIDATTPITDANITFDATARTMTIVPPLGYFNIFVDGNGVIRRYRKVGNVTFPAWTDTSGMWYFYFNSSGIAVTTQTAWTGADFASVAPVYRMVWNKELFNFTVSAATATLGDTYTNNGSTFTVLESIIGGTILKTKRTIGTNNPETTGNLVIATGAGTNPIVFSAFLESPKNVAQYVEYHLNTIPAETHRWEHANGAIWMNGFVVASNAITSGAPNADGRNSVLALTTGTNSDENLSYTITNSTGGLNWQQDLGNTTPASLNATNSALFKILQQDASSNLSFLPATRFPFPWNGTTNLPEYITSIGTRTTMTNGNFLPIFIYATQNPINGEALKALTWTSDFTTITNARAINVTDVQNAYPAFANDREIRPMYRIIIEYRTTYDIACKKAVIREIQDIRQASVTSTTTVTGSLPASSVTVVPYGTITSTNAQSALQELSDEKVALGGIAGGQTITGGTATTENLNIRANNADLTTGQVNFLDTLQSNNTIVAGASTLTGAAIFDGGVGIKKNLRVLGGVITNFYFAGIPQYQMNRINGSIASASRILSGDVIGQLSFNGYTDTINATDTGAYIRAVATGDYLSGTNKPTDVIIATASATGIATEALRVTSLQRVGIGFTDPAVPLETTTAIRITRIASNAILQINRINGTRDARTAVLSGDIIGDINFTGSYDATTNVTTGAVIQAVATNNWSNTVRSTDIVIKTAPASGIVAEIARFTGVGGYFGVGTPLPLSKQHTVGVSQTASGNAILTLSTGTGLSTDESLYFGIYDGNYSWIQAVKQGTANRPLLLNPNGGNVAINSAIAPSPLYVSGVTQNFAFTADPASNKGILTIDSDNTVQLLIGSKVYGTGGNGYGMWMQTKDRSGSSATFNLLLNPAGGNVGFGTLTPADIIDAQKNQNATTNFYFRNTDTTGSNARAYLNVIAGDASITLGALHTGDAYIAGTSGRSMYFQQNIGGNVNVEITSGGYTKLGSTTAPAIKMKKITGTTASTEGGDVSIAHGLDGNKIISMTVKVAQDTGYGFYPEYSYTAGFHFSFYHNGSVIYVINHPTSSEQILSKPITIVIFYEE